ncbi:MAG TPA: TetR/AcrR family transcriptional regulator [Gemmatimonadaceae bacterium]|nr:TetR/AcrR family transcriptional regulator [Gemmatimonadaceae bacterium]
MRDRRAQIIESATSLINRRGYQQTSVEDVIKDAGLCGKAHFYHYFKSKEELGHAVLNRQFETFAERGLAVLRDPMLDPLERLNVFIDTVVESHAEQGCQGTPCIGGFTVEMAEENESFRARVEALFERWAEHIESLLWEVRPRMRDGFDGARMARFVIATLEGALLMSRVKREISVMEGIAEDLKRFIGLHVQEGAMSHRA